MATGYILYNPISGSKNAQKEISLLDIVMETPLVAQDITKIKDYSEFFSTLEEDDYLIIAGGDGTLCRFINDTEGLDFSGKIYYYPIGSGNDFAKDMGKQKNANPFLITENLKNLPTVEVRGQKYRFLNGIGYGIDGYCCEVGDELRKIPRQKGQLHQYRH